MASVNDILFEVEVPLGFTVRCSKSYWSFIVSKKHPVMKGRNQDIENTLKMPDEVRKSRRDPRVYLFYKGKKPHWLCAVVRKKNGTGFLITAYPTDSIKIGATAWTKSK